MNRSRTFARVAVAGLAAAGFVAAAAAQAPQFTDLPIATQASDVTFVNNEAVVVGADNIGVFRWTASTGKVGLNASSAGGNVRISNDGVRVATTINTTGTSRAAYWNGTTWTEIPGLGGTSGTSETTAYDISGDGQTLVGLGWITAGTAHCFSWTSAGGTIDHGGPFSDPSSRANAVNGNGTVIVGWKNSLANQRQAARWLNGTLSVLHYVNPNMVSFQLGEAFAVNGNGSVVVGSGVIGGDNSAWRWDASTGNATLLPNLPGETTNAVATGVSDDGMIIVGHSGGNAINGTHAIIWIGGQPHRLSDYLTSIGVQNMPSYTDLGYVSAISGDGNVVVGYGTGFGLGQAASGWVVELNGAGHTGTSFCSGDGTGIACPCGNSGLAGQGCASSVNAQGAMLAAQGTASLSNDSVVLLGSGMPNSSALYFQGTTQAGGGAGTTFGDGLRCAGGSIVRLRAVTNASGASQYPNAGNPSVSVKGAITSAGVRTYQIWYRNAAAFCTPSTFNLTNGLSVTWSS